MTMRPAAFRPSSPGPAAPWQGRWWALLPALLLAACSQTKAPPLPAAPAPASPAQATAPARPAAPRTVLLPPLPAATGEAARSARLVVHVAQPGDDFEAVARRYLGDAAQAWQVADANPAVQRPQPGQPLVVPLQLHNPWGVTPQGAQSLTILCYHRLGDTASKMSLRPQDFAAQMDWLAEQGYRVVPLSDVAAWQAGQRALPQRAVAISFDDGYRSVIDHALPVLRRHGFTATLFLYTDFPGARDALSWKQLDELVASGLVQVQAHSKTHANLTRRQSGESDAAYAARLDREARESRQAIERGLAAHAVTVRQFAYPYGAANPEVLAALQRQHYELGLTVSPGANPFYAAPLMLRRTMVFGDAPLQAFKILMRSKQLGQGDAGPAPATLEALAAAQAAAARQAAAQGRWADALWAWEVLLTLNPGDSAARSAWANAHEAARTAAASGLQRAELARRQGDLKSAQRHYLAALAAEPSLRAAADALRDIESARNRRSGVPKPGSAGTTMAQTAPR